MPQYIYNKCADSKKKCNSSSSSSEPKKCSEKKHGRRKSSSSSSDRKRLECIMKKQHKKMNKSCSDKKETKCEPPKCEPSEKRRRHRRKNSDKKCKKSCSDKKPCNPCPEEKCCKLLYSLGAWADDAVTKIVFIPKCGTQIVWSIADGSLTPATIGPLPPPDLNWVMQTPLPGPLFPLKICKCDRFEITYTNLADGKDGLTPNALAVAANVDGVTLKTFKPSLGAQPNQLILTAKTLGSSIVNPSYGPVTDIATRNIVDTPNYVAISPNIIGDITVVWTIC